MAYADGAEGGEQSRAREAPGLEQCSLAAAIELVGDRWVLLIIRSALYGVTRFDHMQSTLGMPRTVLSNRLKRLVDGGVLRRRPYKEDGQRTRHQYVLTSKGVELAVPLMALMQWGEKHLCDGTVGAHALTDKTGKMLRAGLISEDGRPVALRDAQFLRRA